MPKFRSLSDAIHAQISDAMQQQQQPYASSVALQSGQVLPPELPADLNRTGVQRWGFSTWGIDPIIGVLDPQDLD